MRSEEGKKNIGIFTFLKEIGYIPVLPRIMNFGRIRIPNIIRIFKNDEYEYEYYLEFKKLFEYYSCEIFE